MPFKKEYKPIFKFEYPCYICGYIFSRAKTVVDHVRRIHGYELPTRHVGHKRPPNPAYDYQNDMNGKFDEIHLACSSCWFHCQESALQELGLHIKKDHDPKNIDPSKNDNGKQPTQFPSKIIRSYEEEEEGGYETAESSGFTEHVKTDKKKKEKSAMQSVEASEIMSKLNELTDLFKSLLK